MTNAQKRALEELWSTYGFGSDSGLAGQIAGYENAERSLEIGFGDGDALLSLAKENPMRCFIGIDPHRPGAGRLLLRLQQEGIENVRIAIGDAAELVPTIDPGSISQILILFPDPWPKKRHHKRRLLGPEMAALLSAKLESEGVLHTATDWEPYAEQMLEVLESESSLTNRHGEGQYAPDADVRPETRFEERGRKLGHGVWDLQFSRSG